jgi:hypothetical protein
MQIISKVPTPKKLFSFAKKYAYTWIYFYRIYYYIIFIPTLVLLQQ